MQLNLQSVSAGLPVYSWYKFNGARGVSLTNSKTKRMLKPNDLFGVRELRDSSWNLVFPDAMRSTFKLDAKNVNRLILKSKLTKYEPEESVVKAPVGSKATEAAIIKGQWDSLRFKPLNPPSNEIASRGKGLAGAGIDTSNYQWRKVTDTNFEIHTNKKIKKVARGTLIGMRFVKPNQGGKVVSLDGMLYNTLETAEYDRVVSMTKLVPHAQWPNVIITPEQVQAFRDQHRADYLKDKREKEATEAALERAKKIEVRNQRLAAELAERQRKQEENQRIAEQAAELAKKLEAKMKAEPEDTKPKPMSDEDFKKYKAGKGKSFESSYDEGEEEEDAEDDSENSDKKAKGSKEAKSKKVDKEDSAPDTSDAGSDSDSDDDSEDAEGTGDTTIVSKDESDKDDSDDDGDQEGDEGDEDAETDSEEDEDASEEETGKPKPKAEVDDGEDEELVDERDTATTHDIAHAMRGDVDEGDDSDTDGLDGDEELPDEDEAQHKSKPSKGKKKPEAADVKDEGDTGEEDDGEDKEESVDNAGAEDEDAKVADKEDTGKAVVGDGKSVEAGAVLKFHDDKKDKNEYAVLSYDTHQNADHLLIYRVYDITNNPEEIREIRINTKRHQKLTDMADVVRELKSKEFNALVDKTDNYDVNKKPIVS